jgi:hypothetical protein
VAETSNRRDEDDDDIVDALPIGCLEMALPDRGPVFEAIEAFIVVGIWLLPLPAAARVEFVDKDDLVDDLGMTTS